MGYSSSEYPAHASEWGHAREREKSIPWIHLYIAYFTSIFQNMCFISITRKSTIKQTCLHALNVRNNQHFSEPHSHILAQSMFTWFKNEHALEIEWSDLSLWSHGILWQLIHIKGTKWINNPPTIIMVLLFQPQTHFSGIYLNHTQLSYVTLFDPSYVESLTTCLQLQSQHEEVSSSDQTSKPWESFRWQWSSSWPKHRKPHRTQPYSW
jgi:hypothetical protein